MGQVAELDQAQGELFGRRLHALESCTGKLKILRRTYAELQVTERQQKARIYEENMHVAHGERQGLATHGTAAIASEILQIKGEIEMLEDERRFLEFCVTYDVGG